MKAATIDVQAWTYGTRMPYDPVEVWFHAQVPGAYCYEFGGLQQIEILGDDGFWDSSTPYFGSNEEHSGIFFDYFAVGEGYSTISYQVIASAYVCDWGWDEAYAWTSISPTPHFPYTVVGTLWSESGQTPAWCPTGSNCCGYKQVRSYSVKSQWGTSMTWLNGAWSEDVYPSNIQCAMDLETGGGEFSGGYFQDVIATCSPNGAACCANPSAEVCDNTYEQYLWVNGFPVDPPNDLHYRCISTQVIPWW